MSQRLEGVHVGLLRQVTRSKAKIMKDGSCKKVATEKVLQGEGTQLIQIYLDMRQAAVV